MELCYLTCAQNHNRGLIVCINLRAILAQILHFSPRDFLQGLHNGRIESNQITGLTCDVFEMRSELIEGYRRGKGGKLASTSDFSIGL